MILRILVVEDSREQLEFTEITLQQLIGRLKSSIGIDNLHIDTASCGAEARRRLENAVQTGETYDLMLLDLGIPEIDGADEDPRGGLNILEFTRDKNAVSYPIIITVFRDDRYYNAAYYMGAFDFIAKPYTEERLLDSVIAAIKDLIATHSEESKLVKEIGRRIVGESPDIRKIVRDIARVIPTDVCVLLTGESGTGKDLIAEVIHHLGPRNKSPWLPINLSEKTSDSLIESHLFGHEKGAFTSAFHQHNGVLERVGDGTLFLNEIGELKPEIQIKLLSVIERKPYQRISGNQNLKFTGRLISATNRDLDGAIRTGKFREDLYQRISTYTINIPPLRMRKGDVDVLLEYYRVKFQKKHLNGREVIFVKETLEILHNHHFPGNVRELQQIVESAVIRCEGNKIQPRHILPSLRRGPKEKGAASSPATSDKSKDRTLINKLFQEMQAILPEDWQHLPYTEVKEKCIRALDRVYLPYHLERNFYNVTKAADLIKIDPKTLRARWKEADLPPIRGDKD
jgi:DNA-binding NtrC family response regulator